MRYGGTFVAPAMFSCLIVLGSAGLLQAGERGPASIISAAAPAPIGASLYKDLFDSSAISLDAAAASVAPDVQQSSSRPQHTGFSTLVHETASDFASFPRRKSTWVILGIGAGLAAIARPFDKELNNELQESDTLKKVFIPGRYLGYGWVRGGAAVGLYIVGRYFMEPEQGAHTNKVSHLGFDLLRANLLTQAFTYGIKYATQRDRPTGECCSFPSGHASVTFATASVIERHFGYRAAWPTFVIAGYVSASRLTDNRHFLSDVLFGSALGMACGWTVVGRHGRENFALYPMPIHGGVAVAGTWTPGRADGVSSTVASR